MGSMALHELGWPKNPAVLLSNLHG